MTCVLIMVDLDRRESDLSSHGPEVVAIEAVENHKKWVEAAAALGCHAIRVNTGEHYSPTDVAAVFESLRRALSDYG